MQQHRLIALIAGLMVLTGAGMDYGLGPMAVAVPHQLPVDSFPSRIGTWQGGAIAPVDPDIQARLPTSKIMDRVYTNRAGREADVMLVTASDNLDIHNPLDCFPSQGWKLTNLRQQIVGGQQVNVMDAQLDDQKMTVMYWTTGYYEPPASPHPFVRSVSALRTKILGRRQADSLFVRLMVPANSQSEEALTQLAAQVLPPVQSLLDAGKRGGEQVSATGRTVQTDPLDTQERQS